MFDCFVGFLSWPVAKFQLRARNCHPKTFVQNARSQQPSDSALRHLHPSEVVSHHSKSAAKAATHKKELLKFLKDVFSQGSGKQASTSGEVIVGGGGGGKDNVEALTPEQALDRFMACGIDSVGE